VGSWRPDGQAHRSPAGACGASRRTAAGPVPPLRRRDAGWHAAQSPSRHPNRDPVPPWPERAAPLPAAVVSSETVAAHPEAAREPPLLRPARRHITVPLHGYSTGTGQTPRPYAGSRPAGSAPLAPETSSLRAPRSHHRAPVAVLRREATPPDPSGATPNSCCDRNGELTPPGHNRSAAPVQPAAIPLPAPFRGRRSASTGPAAAPPLRSETRPKPPPCPGPVASVPRSADSRR
jgi:hypothetical protein